MANPLLDLLSGVGTVLDTPGSVVRGLLSGDADSALGGILDPNRRVSGRDLLDKWGITNNDSGLLGDVGGFAAQVATDPLTYVGGSLLKNLLKGAAPTASVASKANAAADAAMQAAKAPTPLLRATSAGEAAAGLKAAPGVGGYRQLADGTIERIAPQAATTVPGVPAVGPGGVQTYAGGTGTANGLTTAEQFTGRTLPDTRASIAATTPQIPNPGMASRPGPVENILPLRRQFTKVVADFDQAGNPSLRSTGGLSALEPGQSAAQREQQIASGGGQSLQDIQGGLAQAQYRLPERTATVMEGAGVPTVRHELSHGLYDIASRGDDLGKIPVIPRISKRMQFSQDPDVRALGFLGEEMAAHGAQSRGALPQLQNMMEFMRKPIQGYGEQAASISPLARDIYESAAIPRLGLAGYGLGAAGGSTLLASLLGGQQ